MSTCCFITILIFWRVKIDINEKGFNLKSPEKSEAFKTYSAATWTAEYGRMILSLMSFEQYLRGFEATFSYYSIIVFLYNICDFSRFLF